MLMVTPIQSLRHYPRALSYAKRAYDLLGGKEPRAIVYLTQAYPNNEAAAKPLETVRRGLALVPRRRPPKNRPKFTRLWRASFATSRFWSRPAICGRATCHAGETPPARRASVGRASPAARGGLNRPAALPSMKSLLLWDAHRPLPGSWRAARDGGYTGLIRPLEPIYTGSDKLSTLFLALCVPVTSRVS